LDIRKGLPLKDGNEIIGSRTKVRVVKNKLAAPFRECEFDVIFGQGISREGDLLDLAADLNLVQKSGSWYSYGSERMAQGRENAKAFLREHPEVLAELDTQVRTKFGVTKNPGSESETVKGETA
jgi:recombination protein RecA